MTWTKESKSENIHLCLSACIAEKDNSDHLLSNEKKMRKKKLIFF